MTKALWCRAAWQWWPCPVIGSVSSHPKGIGCRPAILGAPERCSEQLNKIQGVPEALVREWEPQGPQLRRAGQSGACQAGPGRAQLAGMAGREPEAPQNISLHPLSAPARRQTSHSAADESQQYRHVSSISAEPLTGSRCPKAL